MDSPAVALAGCSTQGPLPWPPPQRPFLLLQPLNLPPRARRSWRRGSANAAKHNKVSTGCPEAFTAAAALPDGPTTAKELLDFVPRVMKAVFAIKEALPRINDALSAGFTITTDYSGIDAPMVALVRIRNYVKEYNYNQEVTFVHYSSCELQPPLQKLLKESKPPPHHIFGDLLDHIPGAYRATMDGMIAALPKKKPKTELNGYQQEAYPAFAFVVPVFL